MRKIRWSKVPIDDPSKDISLCVCEDALTHKECDQLIEMASQRLQVSAVVDRQDGSNKLSIDVRNSQQAWFKYHEFPLITRLDKRFAESINIDDRYAEDLQVLKYEKGGFYAPHHDYFDPQDPGSAGTLIKDGQRAATILVYLNDVLGGGATRFPILNTSINPKKGRAVLFLSTNSSGDILNESLHEGCLVTNGIKFLATRWFRMKPMQEAYALELKNRNKK